MKLSTILLTLMVLMSISIAGCIPLSLHGIHDDNNTVYNTCLIGSWCNSDKPEELWEFSKDDDKSYKIALTIDGKTAYFKAHLVQLEDKLFLDIFPKESELETNMYYMAHLVPVHSFLQVRQIEPNLQLMAMDLKYTEKLLKENPDLIPHEFAADRLIFTAPPEEVRKFLLENADNKELFKDTLDLQLQEKTLPIQKQIETARQQVHYKDNPADITTTSVLDKFNIKSKKRPSFWQPAAVKAKILCQDGGNPIPLPDGSAFMTYGDTFIGKWKSDGKPDWTGAVSNSISRVTPRAGNIDVQYLTDKNGQVDFLIPLHNTETWEKHRIWPHAGIHVDGTTYLYYSRILLTGKGTWSFTDDGCGLAQAQGTSWNFSRTVMPHSDPPILIEPHSILRDKQNYIYLFYLERQGQYQCSAYAARVNSADKLSDPTSYEYFSGRQHGFTKDKSAQYPIVNDVFGQYTVQWNEYLNCYVLLHVGGLFDNPRTIYLRTAQFPWGPWSKTTPVYSQPGELRDDLKGLFYCPFLQPQLFREKGRIMVFTYCHVEDFANPFCVEIEISPK